MKMKSESEVVCDGMDSSPPGSSAHGIFQARVLEWGAIAFSAYKILGISKPGLVTQFLVLGIHSHILVSEI